MSPKKQERATTDNKEEEDDMEVGDLLSPNSQKVSSSTRFRFIQQKRACLERQPGVWNLLEGAVFRGFWIDPVEASLEPWVLERDDDDSYLAMAVAPPDALPAPAAESKKDWCRWLDIDGSDGGTEEDEIWIDKLNLGGFISGELCKPIANWNSHVIGMRSKVLLKLRIMPAGMLTGEVSPDIPSLIAGYDGSGVNNDPKHHHNINHDQYVAAVISKNLLVTWNTFEGGPNQKFKSLSQQVFSYLTVDDDESPLHDGSTSSALIAWMDFHLGRTFQYMLDLRNSSAALVIRMDMDPACVDISDVMDFKNKLLLALAVSEEQAQCINMMKKLDKDRDFATGMDFSKLKGSLSCLIATADATERMALRLEKRSIYLRQQFEAYQQERINNRLAVLTVLSAIFMPLTFLAGIYGMNFENMPELHYENGYFIFWGVQGSIALIMLLFFYSRGWFG
eukprot:scaffold586_cov68-Cylindrotheca_fusiformis.AAC.16